MRGASNGVEGDDTAALKRQLADSGRKRSNALERLLRAAGEATKAGETASFDVVPTNGTKPEAEEDEAVDEDHLAPDDSGIHKLDPELREKLRQQALAETKHDREAAIIKLKQTAQSVKTYRPTTFFDRGELPVAAGPPPGPDDLGPV